MRRRYESDKRDRVRGSTQERAAGAVAIFAAAILFVSFSLEAAGTETPLRWHPETASLEVTPDGRDGWYFRFDREETRETSSSAHTDDIELHLGPSSAFIFELAEFSDHTSFHLLWMEPEGPQFTLKATGMAGRYVVPFCRGQKATTAGVPFAAPLGEGARGKLRVWVHSPGEHATWHLRLLRFEPELDVPRPYPLGFTDLDNDGDPDLLRLHNGSLDIIYVDDDDDMTAQDTRGDADSDLVVVDKTMDGVYDGPGDFVYDPVDIDGDGDADYEFSCTTTDGFGSCGLRYVDYDDDNRMAYLDFENFTLTNENAYSERGSYRFDYAGNGFFLKMPLFLAGWRMSNPEMFWENPIAWYDTDDDGFTEMIVRCGDQGDPDGRIEAFDVAFDADNDTTVGNESDLDWELSFRTSPSRAMEYQHVGRSRYPGIRGIDEVNSTLFVTNPWFRALDTWTHVPYFKALGMGTQHPAWDSCTFVVDEDDEDVRWEEMFSPSQEPGVLCGYSDKVGDRWEVDDDYSGGGQLYRAAFDGRLHLYGADRGEWTVDYHGLYHGSVDRSSPGFDEPPLPPRRMEEDGRPIVIWSARETDLLLKFSRVRYSDTDGNGFIDRIEYDDDGRPETVERAVNLLDFATLDMPHPDVRQLWDLKGQAEAAGAFRPEEWDGKSVRFRSEVYDRIHADEVTWAERNWLDALMLHKAAKAAGLAIREDEPECTLPADASLEQREAAREYLVLPGYGGLLHAETTAHKQRNAYWLREKVFADVLRETHDEALSAEYRRLFYTGQTAELCRRLTERDRNDGSVREATAPRRQE